MNKNTNNYTKIRRYFISFGLILLVSGILIGSDFETSKDTSNTPNTTAVQNIVYTEGNQFMLNGKEFYYAGSNQYYMNFKNRDMVDDVLNDAVSMKLQVLRVWGHLDVGTLNADGTFSNNADGVGEKGGVYLQYWDPDTNAPAFNGGADGMEGLDYVLKAANDRNIKLIFTLTNNWKEFGGMLQYVMWDGGTDKDTFYTNPNCKQWYKDWVSFVLNRVNTISGITYKDDPAIFSWELANEPRCQSDSTGDTVVNWVTEMSAYIKSIDSKHMVSVGDEGFFSYTYDESMAKFGTNHWAYVGGEGTDWNRFMELPNIDFGTVHLYPDHWSTTPEWGISWIEHHAQENHNKPWILEEYGYKDKTTRDAVYTDWFQAIIDNDINGDNFWILSGIMEDGSLYPDYDGFTVYYPSDTATLISNHAQAMIDKSGGGEPDYIPPAAPTGLQMDIYSSNQINLNWDDNTEIDLDKYNIYRSLSSNVQNITANLVGDSQTSEFIDDTVNPETTYFYMVTAIDNSDNQSPGSNEESGRTPEPDITPPNSPTQLSATAVSTSKIELNWADNTESDLKEYIVYRSLSSGFTPSASNQISSPTNSEFSDVGLGDNTNYYYKVVAVDTSDNPSIASAEVSAKTLKIIAQIRAQYYCGGTDASSVDIRPRVQLFNDGPLNVNLADISFRYWFTSESGVYTLSNSIDYAAVGNAEITSSFGDNGAIQYLQAGFTTSANVPTWLGGSGAANEFPISASTGDIQLRIVSSDSTNFNQADDYSYDSTITSYTDYSKITVYYNNDLVWGVEPPIGENVAPVVSSPADITYEVDNTGAYSISWTLTDSNPATYTITGPSGTSTPVAWVSGAVISEDVSGLTEGTHTYTITAVDDEGLSTSDSVDVVVMPIANVPPSVSSPGDITYQEGAIGTFSISWTLTDSNPATYTITNPSGTSTPVAWVSGAVITEDVSALSEGTHTYTITAEDNEGLSVSDSVDVIVTPANLVGGDVSMQDIADIKVGDVFDTTIVVDTGVQLLAGYGFVISFDPAILQASAVVASATGFMAAVNIDNVAGTITVAGFDANGVGPTSALELIVISWEAIDEGESVIDIQVNELVDETTAVIGTPNGIANSIIVGPDYDLGDVNNDGKVDIVDALLVAQFYVGEVVSIEEYLADVNLDGKIDIVDALLIAQFYVGVIPVLPPDSELQ